MRPPYALKCFFAFIAVCSYIRHTRGPRPDSITKRITRRKSLLCYPRVRCARWVSPLFPLSLYRTPRTYQMRVPHIPTRRCYCYCAATAYTNVVVQSGGAPVEGPAHRANCSLLLLFCYFCHNKRGAKRARTHRQGIAPAFDTPQAAPKQRIAHETTKATIRDSAYKERLVQHQQKLKSARVIAYSPIDTKCAVPRRT